MMDNIEQESELFEGIKKSVWHCFIDKNASRYVEIFKKNEGQKIFISWNWAAFLFNINWMFYRRMYKLAICFFALYSVISILLTLSFTSFYMDELEPLVKGVIEFEKNYDPYDLLFNVSNNNKEEILSFDVYHTIEDIEFISNKITVWTAFGIVLLYIPFGLYADCIYKAHIHNNIEKSKGGISFKGLIAGLIGIYIVNIILVNPITNILMGLFIKQAIK